MTEMQDFQQRVLDEKKDLDGRLERLRAFMQGPDYAVLPWDERCRMADQAAAMSVYSALLGERIVAFA